MLATLTAESKVNKRNTLNCALPGELPEFWEMQDIKVGPIVLKNSSLI